MNFKLQLVNKAAFNKKRNEILSSLPVRLSNGKILSIQIKRSKKTSKLWLKANISGIYVIVPMINYEIDKVMKFIESKKDWILKTSEYFSKLQHDYPDENLKSDTIFFLGKRYNLRISKDIAPSVIVSDNLRTISFHVTDRRRYKNDVKQWYFSQTSMIVSERLNLIRQRDPTLPGYKKVSIKDQRSRWASCSKNGNLSFNLFLSSLPLEIIDYVIIHELAHLIELNHSREFWDIVRLADPEFLHHRKLLRNDLSHTFGL